MTGVPARGLLSLGIGLASAPEGERVNKGGA